ncbi:selenoprotein H isoform X1 [Juglans microcarpa x Juglans regia]|uniref:selenoprotein H isoform X1 n=1 Tax=Juglans microcarpa x Juglans regia TaxID=2249226 RepID=UPI001B7E3295|nr:selenoprotein H isoform X1 [Juglans microcarpa x Juglans regia]
MAPRKRRVVEEEPAKSKLPTRVTRSAAKRAANPNSADFVSEGPRTDLPKKKAKKVVSKEEQGKEISKAAKTKTIVIEHCKQCNSFKTRAIRVKEGLEKGVSGVTVLVNPNKPRKGCFEIREDGGETFISLLDMKRPFAPMKALEMDKVISDIIDKIK